MIADSFCQDVRVGLRVLLNDKAFSGASSYPRRSSDCAAL